MDCELLPIILPSLLPSPSWIENYQDDGVIMLTNSKTGFNMKYSTQPLFIQCVSHSHFSMPYISIIVQSKPILISIYTGNFLQQHSYFTIIIGIIELSVYPVSINSQHWLLFLMKSPQNHLNFCSHPIQDRFVDFQFYKYSTKLYVALSTKYFFALTLPHTILYIPL